MASIISTKTSGGGGIAVTGDTSGVMQLASNDGTTAVTIDASQNVGIGTASPLYKLNVNGSSIGIGATGTGNPAFEAVTTDAAGIAYLALKNGTRDYSIRVEGTDAALTFRDNTAVAERMRIDSVGNLKFNSGYGSVATAYGCRAWVNFNGTGTVAIRASGNVSSITDNGVGIYTINLTNAMPDVNYAVFGSGRYQTAGGSDDSPIVGLTGANFSTPTTSAFQIGTTTDTAAGVDCATVNVSVFR